MKRAIREHRFDFAAIGVLIAAAIAVSAYILGHQPSFVFGQTYYTVRAPFATAAAVTSGQGQAVTIAGVQVGQIGGVTLHDGQAIVTMNIYKQYAPIYRDATVLLRPRTPLKDMYLALDPGTRGAGRVPNGGTLSAANTQPDVDLSEILSSLDTDTRNYLVLLLSGGAQAFHNPGATVTGLNIVPLADQPPVNVVRFAFQTMVGIGTLLALLGLLWLWVRIRRRSLPSWRWFYWAVLAAGPLSVVALIAGWITTEVGRQPYIVYDVMRVDTAVTGAHVIPFGYTALWLVYLLLAFAVVWILRRFGRVPLPESPLPESPLPELPLPEPGGDDAG